MAENYDMAIIGSGPGGYVAAIRAAQLGFKTVCIDKNPSLGGACLNVGCIPSKALLQTTEFLYHLQTQGKDLGIQCRQLDVNFPKMMERKNEVVKTLNGGIASLFRKNRIDFVEGSAEFIDPHLLRIIQRGGQEKTIKAAFIGIATGSQPISLPGIPFAKDQVLSSTGALSLSKVPKRFIVIGAGAIGVELGSVYRRLGSEVIIVEMLDHICPAFDSDLSKNLQKALEKQGIKFLLSSKVLAASLNSNEVILSAIVNGAEQKLKAEAVLVAVGRYPCTDGLELERIGIQKDKKGFIPVDGAFRTIHTHIFAIGDCIEGPMLAHRASAEAIAAIDSLRGSPSTLNYMAVPNVVYTYPEAASVGLTEEEAKQAGLNTLVGKSFFRANPRALCSGETEGFVKILGDKRTQRLVGLHILGPHASELISSGVIAIEKQAKLSDIADAPQAHPTLSEAIKEAALSALGRP